MLTTIIRISKLQEALNNLLESEKAYTENYQEIYQLSQQLDELIVQYYQEA